MARILVIDDNETDVRLAAYLLSAAGHTPITAGDGRDGLQMVAREAPDAIPCDVAMPNTDGYDVCRQLKASTQHRNIPVIAVTALGSPGERRAILAAGFDGYIAKPVDPRTLVRQVEAFLDEPHTAAATAAPVEAAPPAAVSPVSQPPLPPTPDVPRARLLLALDDSRSNQSLFDAIFVPSGYRVLPAGTVQEAKDLLDREPPDLILSDVYLPDGTGFDLIRTVKADPRQRDVPFLFITSTAWPERNRRAGMSLGADGYIVRPIDSRDLLAGVEALLRERKGD